MTWRNGHTFRDALVCESVHEGEEGEVCFAGLSKVRRFSAFVTVSWSSWQIFARSTFAVKSKKCCEVGQTPQPLLGEAGGSRELEDEEAVIGGRSTSCSQIQSPHPCY